MQPVNIYILYPYNELATHRHACIFYEFAVTTDVIDYINQTFKYHLLKHMHPKYLPTFCNTTLNA